MTAGALEFLGCAHGSADVASGFQQGEKGTQAQGQNGTPDARLISTRGNQRK
jgi:hypothetical protein